VTDQPPVWHTLPQSLTQISFFYPPPGLMTYQVEYTFTLPNMEIGIHILYLDPPYMVPILSIYPQTTTLPMQTLVQPTLPQPCHTVGDKDTNTRGKKNKYGGNTSATPWVQPPCVLYETQGHPTNLCPTLP
jgi:hypothetical protein